LSRIDPGPAPTGRSMTASEDVIDLPGRRADP
jgi:hypothetical protein